MPQRMPPSLAHPLSGETAPGLDDLASAAASPLEPADASARPRSMVVEFWASWCDGCSVTMPALEALWRDRRDDGLLVVGVSVDESEAAAAAAARRLGASFPIVVDAEQELASSWRVGRLPLTFVVDRSGTVRWVGRNPDDARRAAEVVLFE